MNLAHDQQEAGRVGWDMEAESEHLLKQKGQKAMRGKQGLMSSLVGRETGISGSHEKTVIVCEMG